MDSCVRCLAYSNRILSGKWISIQLLLFSPDFSKGEMQFNEIISSVDNQWIIFCAIYLNIMKQVLPTVNLLYWKRELLILNYFTLYLVTLSDRHCFPKTLWMDIIMDNFYPTCFQPFRAKESNFMYIHLSCLTIFLNFCTRYRRC